MVPRVRPIELSHSSFNSTVMMNVVVVAILLIAFPGILDAQQKLDLTVERIYQKPYLGGTRFENVQWLPDGLRFSYLRADSSTDVKDLWIYDMRTSSSSLLLKAIEILDGEQTFSAEEQERRERLRETGIGITRYFWSPDGKHVYLPLSGDVYKVEIETRTVTRVTASPEPEYDPKLSPTGTHLAYVRNGEIFVRDLQSKSERKLTSGSSDLVKNGISEFVAQEEMDRTTGYWWAPDGKHLAYLQIDDSPVATFHIPNFLSPSTSIDYQRYPKAGEANTRVRVGVVAATGGKTRWLDLGKNSDVYIARVVWHPGGNQVSVQRQSRNQDTLDLLLCDIRNGKSKLVLRETNPRWVTLHDDLRFLQGGKEFLWSSERDGYRHIYRYAIDGTLISQLTKGTWDIDHILAVDEPKKIGYFTGAEKSPTERHLYAFHLEKGNWRRISVLDGWHDVTISPTYLRYVDLHSTSTRPPWIGLGDVYQQHMKTVEGNLPVELDRYRLPNPEFFTIKAGDGTDLHAFMIKPTAFDSLKKYPVILYTYNGPTSQIVLNMWGAGGGMARVLWHRMMAEQGYIVFGVDGRGTPRRGREFLDVVHKRLGYHELNDQLEGAAYLKSLAFVDSTRVMIWGKSYGGFMACMAMFTTGEHFKLGMALAPVTDWRNYDTHYTERYLETPAENPEGYRLSSPMSFAANLKKKFLIVHGAIDDNVHFQDSMLLVETLQNANRQFDFMPYPRTTHALGIDGTGIHMYNLLTRYIHNNL